ncbi:MULTISPECIES: hypothetical protein [Fibrobacter]|uniref:hypothetical protein n=1 Tax=Fibrobacter TaxID=832 RepID=UPI0013042A59|nr:MULTISPECIES: hypothetical protein [Fibrobacter]
MTKQFFGESFPKDGLVATRLAGMKEILRVSHWHGADVHFSPGTAFGMMLKQVSG